MLRTGPFHIFAVRVHGHARGRMIRGSILRASAESDGGGGRRMWQPFYERSPQDPQNFYYLREQLVVQVLGACICLPVCSICVHLFVRKNVYMCARDTARCQRVNSFDQEGDILHVECEYEEHGNVKVSFFFVITAHSPRAFVLRSISG